VDGDDHGRDHEARHEHREDREQNDLSRSPHAKTVAAKPPFGFRRPP
jgi:hypothetical protein